MQFTADNPFPHLDALPIVAREPVVHYGDTHVVRSAVVLRKCLGCEKRWTHDNASESQSWNTAIKVIQHRAECTNLDFMLGMKGVAPETLEPLN